MILNIYKSSPINSRSFFVWVNIGYNYFEVIIVYKKFLKMYSCLSAALTNRKGAVQSTEVVILLLVFVSISLIVVSCIWKLMGDNSDIENGSGILGAGKRMFDSKQN